MLRKDSTATLVEEVPEAPYIPGTESSIRPRRTLKHGDCFVVLDSHADIGTTPGGPDGIFFCDMRHLSLPAGTREITFRPTSVTHARAFSWED